MIRYLPFLIVLGLGVYALIDCITTPEDDVKHLPKIGWILIILLFPLVGSLAWLFAGRDRRPPAGGGRPPSQWPREQRQTWVAPDDNPDFLDSLRKDNAGDEAVLKDWEADLRRREEELRRKEEGRKDEGPEDGRS